MGCERHRDDADFYWPSQHDTIRRVIGVDLAAVRRAATAFRGALEQGGFRSVSLDAFPRGACGDVTELLGQYLADSGLGIWFYQSGTRDEPFQTHAWLERDGWLLDITADQFDGVSTAVLLTSDREWHERHFPYVLRTRPASLAWFGLPAIQANARADYELLKHRADCALQLKSD